MNALKLAVVWSYLHTEFPDAQLTLADDAFTRTDDNVRFAISCQPDVAALEIAHEFFKDRTPLEVWSVLRERRLDHFLRAYPKSLVLLRREDIRLR